MDKFAGIEVFARVVENGSFAAAARLLDLSPAMVGKHIAALEARLGTSLLHRTTRRMALTDVGRLFYERCQGVLREVAAMEQIAASSRLEPQGQLRIAAPISFTELCLAPLLADFACEHHAVNLDIVCDERVVDLVDSGFDIAIRLGKLPDSGLMARRLAPAPVVLCAAPAYLNDFGVPQTLEDLARHHCIAYAYQWARRGWDFRSPDNKDVTVPMGPVVHRTNNAAAQRALALAGCGLTQLPAYVIGPDLRAGRLVALLNDYRPHDRSVYAVFPPSRHLPITVRTLVDFLAQRMALPYWIEQFDVPGT